jgi:small subunit ribosomal protein S21
VTFKVNGAPGPLKALGFYLKNIDGQERKGVKILDIRVQGDNIEKAIKDLKRKLQMEGLFKEIKKRSFYEKPSEKIRRKQREAQKRRLKSLRSKRHA